MKMPQAWTKRLMHIAPNVVIVLTAISLPMNMANSVNSSRGLAFALTFAGFIFASILVKPLSLKYVLAAVAYLAFFNALPELSFDKLVSVMYLSLVLLSCFPAAVAPTNVPRRGILPILHSTLLDRRADGDDSHYDDRRRRQYDPLFAAGLLLPELEKRERDQYGVKLTA